MSRRQSTSLRPHAKTTSGLAVAHAPVAGPAAAYAPDGTLIALVTEEAGQARPLVVFA